MNINKTTIPPRDVVGIISFSLVLEMTHFVIQGKSALHHYWHPLENTFVINQKSLLSECGCFSIRVKPISTWLLELPQKLLNASLTVNFDHLDHKRLPLILKQSRHCCKPHFIPLQEILSLRSTKLENDLLWLVHKIWPKLLLYQLWNINTNWKLQGLLTS